MPIKYGLAGSSQEKLAAIPLLPAIKAKTGVIQQSDAAMAESMPAPNSLFDAFLLPGMEFRIVIIPLPDFWF